MYNMKCQVIMFFMLAILMALAVTGTLSATPAREGEFAVTDDDDNDTGESPMLTSLRGANRFLAQKSRVKMTCNKYPRICRVIGSPGPDCCKKKCVNVKKDRLNCGMCGKKCKYSEICCGGKCVNPRSDRKHCGGCSTKCKKGSSCVYGMCSYA